jgi:hypothetical protein
LTVKLLYTTGAISGRRESEMSSFECEMSEEETFRSINRIIEYEIEYVTV